MTQVETPKEKLICLVNSCRLVSGMVKHNNAEQYKTGPGADDFLPVLIYAVLRSKPKKI